MTPSKDAPLFCPHFGPCGGCSQLDVPIKDQLEHKRQHAQTLLAPLLDGVVPEIHLPPRTPRHDRMAILYPAQRSGYDVQLGIYRRGTHEILEITDCRIQMKALTRLGQRAAAAMRELGLHAYDENTHKGLVRAFRARVMPGSNELLIGVVATRIEFSERVMLMARLSDAADDLRDDQGRPLRLVGIVVNLNDTPGNALLGPTTAVVRGQGFQTDIVGDLRIRVSFGSFYQQHRHSEAILFRPALAMLGDVKGTTIVDGYGGVGTFALRLLRAGADHVTIVESSPAACADARHNLTDNGFTNGEVREQAFGSAPLPACHVLLVDPPRAGLMERGASAVVQSRAERVLLVSCALESLARDLAALSPHYRVTALRLCDLFPHTEHVEAITMLERR